MNKAIFKQINTYTAFISFFLGLFYIFQEGTLTKFVGCIWFLSCMLNVFIAYRRAKKQQISTGHEADKKERMMTNKKAKLVIVGAILLIIMWSILLFFGVKWVAPRFFPPDNLYRSSTASATGNTIKIDEHYSVVTTNGKTSYLWFIEDGENPVTLDEHVNKLNYDDNYIIIQTVTKNFDSLLFKKYNYSIVNKTTQKVDRFSKKNDFLAECQKRNIDVELKIKEEFDWY